MRHPRTIRVLIALVTLLAAGGYFGCVHRFTTRAENAGWSVEFSYIACACRFCMGRVSYLKYRDQSIVPPRSNRRERPSLISPVGRFEALPGESQYRSHGVEAMTFSVAGAALTPGELESGWYDAVLGGAWPPSRRPGTPEHWCLLLRDDTCRWLAPERMSEFAWATEPLAEEVPDTQPSEQTASQPSDG